MNIKATIVSEQGVEKPFPKIMRRKNVGALVLFRHPSMDGFTIEGGPDNYPLGGKWPPLDSAPFSWEDWTGTIEVKQD